jgi:hypothetical protein
VTRWQPIADEPVIPSKGRAISYWASSAKKDTDGEAKHSRTIAGRPRCDIRLQARFPSEGAALAPARGRVSRGIRAGAKPSPSRLPAQRSNTRKSQTYTVIFHLPPKPPILENGTNQSAQRSRALPRPQQVGNLTTSSFRLDLASHQRAQHIRLRGAASDAEYPEPAELGRVQFVPDAARDLCVGNVEGLQECVVNIEPLTSSSCSPDIFQDKKIPQRSPPSKKRSSNCSPSSPYQAPTQHSHTHTSSPLSTCRRRAHSKSSSRPPSTQASSPRRLIPRTRSYPSHRSLRCGIWRPARCPRCSQRCSRGHSGVRLRWRIWRRRLSG